MKYETIELQKKDRIGTITLNRPDVLNAFSEQLIWDLQDATKNLKEDNDIRVAIITGAGKGFTRNNLQVSDQCFDGFWW